MRRAQSEWFILLHCTEGGKIDYGIKCLRERCYCSFLDEKYLKNFSTWRKFRERYTCKQKDAHARISFSRNFISGISLEREEIYLN